MNENMKKVAEMLKNDNTLADQLSAEAKRLAETMKGKETNEILAQAIKNVLGIGIAAEDLETGLSGIRELTPEAMENVAGGNLFTDLWDKVTKIVDEIKERVIHRA